MVLQEKIVIRYFEYFYSQIYNHPSFAIDLSIQKQDVVLQNFIEAFEKRYGVGSIGKNLLLDYFLFSWNYWVDKDLKRPVRFGWIIGTKARKRWFENKDQYYQYHYRNRLIAPYKINIEYLKLLNSEEDFDAREISPDEEISKERFSGDFRLPGCLTYTSLYNHRSKHCMICHEKIPCKKLLKSQRRDIYEMRGYEAE